MSGIRSRPQTREWDRGYDRVWPKSGLCEAVYCPQCDTLMFLDFNKLSAALHCHNGCCHSQCRAGQRGSDHE